MKLTVRQLTIPKKSELEPCEEYNHFATHFNNIFSIYIPKGEEYFIKYVRKSLPVLKGKVNEEELLKFIHQEANHLVKHRKFNERIIEETPVLRHIHKWQDFFLKFAPKFTLNQNVACVCAVEHFTAHWGKWFLEHRIGELMSDQYTKNMFNWHALEEVEHCEIIVDLYNKLEISYLDRLIGFYMAAFTFFMPMTITIALRMVLDRRTYSLKGWKSFKQFFLSEKSIFKTLGIPQFHYLFSKKLPTVSLGDKLLNHFEAELKPHYEASQ